MNPKQTNIRSVIHEFVRRLDARVLQRAVRVTEEPSGAGKLTTTVTIDARIPRPPFRRGRPAGYLITTEPHVLRDEHFTDTRARARIKVRASKSKGRVGYVVELASHEVVFACCFHVPDEHVAPIEISELLVRGDDVPKRTLSRMAAGWIIPFLAEASSRAKRPAQVAITLEPTEHDDHLELLGFRPKPPPPGYTPEGSRYLVYEVPKRTRS